MQGYCTVIGPQRPFRASYPGTPNAGVQAGGDLDVVWSDGHADTIAAGTDAATVAGATHVDGSAQTWLVVVQHGSAAITLVAQSDRANLDTLLPGATWAVYERLTPQGLITERQ